jgi:hypothetical protein
MNTETFLEDQKEEELHAFIGTRFHILYRSSLLFFDCATTKLEVALRWAFRATDRCVLEAEEHETTGAN